MTNAGLDFGCRENPNLDVSQAVLTAANMLLHHTYRWGSLAASARNPTMHTQAPGLSHSLAQLAVPYEGRQNVCINSYNATATAAPPTCNIQSSHQLH